MISNTISIPDVDVEQLPLRIQRDLRSDHAGEAGAVMIYKGILKVTKDPEIINFAKNHLETENKHLSFFENWMPRKNRSKLTFLWKMSGFLTGVIAASGARYFTYLTIYIIESFVISHYQKQIHTGPSQLCEALRMLQQDEKHHRKEAEAFMCNAPNLLERLRGFALEKGSKGAVLMARLI